MPLRVDHRRRRLTAQPRSVRIVFFTRVRQFRTRKRIVAAVFIVVVRIMCSPNGTYHQNETHPSHAFVSVHVMYSDIRVHDFWPFLVEKPL